MEIGFQHYSITDRSGSVSALVGDTRRRNPAGSLIHTTAGVGSLAWLSGNSAAAGTPAGCNELIGRSGEITILCSPERYPYHAGVSRAYINGKWYTGDGVSEILYGWELECLDREIPTYQQIDSLAQRICIVGSHYGWRWPFIILGHYAVALPAGRKHDPVAFDWGGLMGRLYVAARALDIPGL